MKASHPSGLLTGLFISFEGIDGAGKSSHIAQLAAAFKHQGRVVTLTREPGGTPLAEKLRSMVLNDAMDALTESLLIFAARRDHLIQVIEPALARGEVVLCDRFTDASFAYQGAGRGFDLNVLSQLEQWVQSIQGLEAKFTPNSQSQLRQPELTLWFDLPSPVAAKRLAGARVPDKFESQPVAFFEQVAAGYARRAALDAARFARIDAAQDRAQVWRDIFAVMVQRAYLPGDVGAAAAAERTCAQS